MAERDGSAASAMNAHLRDLLLWLVGTNDRYRGPRWAWADAEQFGYLNRDGSINQAGREALAAEEARRAG